MTQAWIVRTTSAEGPKVGLTAPRIAAPSEVRPSRLWVIGLSLGDDGTVTGPEGWQDSYLADCECPDDCPRDHENE
jgi:hypothetical protein